MSKSRFVLVLIAILIAFSLMGCKQSDSEAILGFWELDESQSAETCDSGATLEFLKDGTVITGGSYTTTYSFPDETHIKFSFGAMQETYSYELDGDVLRLMLPQEDGYCQFKR